MKAKNLMKSWYIPIVDAQVMRDRWGAMYPVRCDVVGHTLRVWFIRGAW